MWASTLFYHKVEMQIWKGQNDFRKSKEKHGNKAKRLWSRIKLIFVVTISSHKDCTRGGENTFYFTKITNTRGIIGGWCKINLYGSIWVFLYHEMETQPWRTWIQSESPEKKNTVKRPSGFDELLSLYICDDDYGS